MGALDFILLPMRHRVTVADDFRMDEVGMLAPGACGEMSIVLG